MMRKKIKKLILPVSFILFVSGIAYAMHENPGLLDKIQYRPLLGVLFLCVPLNIYMLGWELKLVGKLMKCEFLLVGAVKNVIMSSALNILPVPAGYLVRYTYLRDGGINKRDSFLILGFQSFVWVAVALVFSMVISVIYDGINDVDRLFFLAGVLVIVISGILMAVAIHRYNHAWLILGLLGIRFLVVLLSCARVYLCFSALQYDSDMLQVAVVVVARAVASLVFIVPAGLGVTEFLAELMGRGLDIASGMSYLVSALDRIVGWAFLAFGVWIIMLGSKFDDENNKNY